MKHKDIFVFIGFFSIFIISSNLFLPLESNTQNGYFFQSLSHSDVGVSKYNISQTITYQIETNFSLTQQLGFGDYFFKFARLNSRVPNSPLTKFCPPYQESELLYNFIDGYNLSEIDIEHHDKFNNTYDSFNASLSTDDKVTFNQKYTVKLNEIKFQDVKDEDIGEYEMNDEIFELYCNYSEPYYERDDPTLIDLSNSIVNYDDNPIEKAHKIIEWVSNYLTYNDNLPYQEKGALWAYNNGEGDCSEYSSLMITLLRIQDIPARKVTGFLISNSPSFQPKINDTWQFQDSELNHPILRQAWMEYYVPNIGWIACDPTWHSNLTYFNRIDILRFHWNVGANFFVPPSFIVSEFSNPMFVFKSLGQFEFTYDIKVTVINISTPLITINSPIENEIFGRVSPNFSLSIIGAYNDIWYTIDDGMTNITASGLTGTINQTEWDKKGNEEVTIKFYVNNGGGLIGKEDVQVVKLVTEEVSPPLIFGYSIIALIGISIITISELLKYLFRKKDIIF
jgi:hypothetical protein